MRFGVGFAALWFVLAALADNESTSKFAAVLAWTVAGAMTFANGDKALTEVNALLGRD